MVECVMTVWLWTRLETDERGDNDNALCIMQTIPSTNNTGVGMVGIGLISTDGGRKSN